MVLSTEKRERLAEVLALRDNARALQHPLLHLPPKLFLPLLPQPLSMLCPWLPLGPPLLQPPLSGWWRSCLMMRRILQTTLFLRNAGWR